MWKRILVFIVVVGALALWRLWPVLGLNASHDGSVCVLRGDELVVANELDLVRAHPFSAVAIARAGSRS